jgi:hypothetical protein
MAKWRLATATLRRQLQSSSPTISTFKNPTKALSAAAHQSTRSYSTTQTDDSRGKWLTLPPFSPTIDGTAVGKDLLSDGDSVKSSTDNSKTTALRWILRCRPDLPRTLVQKLFRLRQVPSLFQSCIQRIVVSFLHCNWFRLEEKCLWVLMVMNYKEASLKG